MSRESRDLISLTIKCFAAQSYFINSKIINTVEDQDQCEVIAQNSQYPSLHSAGFKDKQNSASQKKERHEANLDSSQNRVYQTSDVLLEMEFVKHDLNQQIMQVRLQQRETQKFKRQFNDLEEEMACTIQSYKNIIEQFQTGDTNQHQSLKNELSEMQNQIQQLESQRNKLLQNQKIVDDEKANLQNRIKQMNAKNDQLVQNLELVQKTMGVPKAQYDSVKAQLKKQQEEIEHLKHELEDHKEFMKQKQKQMSQLSHSQTDNKKQLQAKQEYLEKKEEEVVALRAKCKELESYNAQFQELKQ